jgi:hypothetical protein
MKPQALKAQALAFSCLLFAWPSLASDIEGIVRLGAAERLANVTVHAQLQDDPSTQISTVADGTGAFSFQVGDGTWILSLDTAEMNARGLILTEPRFVSINNSFGYVEMVAKQPDATLSGYVRDETGAGVGNVTVTAYDRPDLSLNLLRAVTDETGFYRFSLASEMTWLVRIDLADLSSLKLLDLGMFGISFNSGDVITRDIEVFRIKYALNMTIVDESSAPVSGASVRVNAFFGDDIRFDLYPQVNGNAATQELPTGAWIVYVDVPAGSVLPRRFHVTNSLDAIFVAHPPPANATIAGRLIDENDQPIANTPITLTRYQSITQLTGPNGEFSFSSPPRQCSITISNQDYLLPITSLVTAPGSTINKTLRAQQVTSYIEVNIEAPPGVFESFGAVARTTAGIEEFVVRGIGTTYIIIPVFDAEWKVTATAYAYQRQSVEHAITAPSNDQSFTATFLAQLGRATIRGKLADDSGAPLSTEFTAVGLTDSNWLFSGPDGSFQFSTVPDDYQFHIDISPRTDALSPNTNLMFLNITFAAPVHVSDGDNIDIGTLRVPVSAAHLTLKLVDPHGTPLNVDDPYLRISAKGTHAEIRGSLLAERTSDNGIFEFDLPAGKWTFEFPDEDLNSYGYAGVGALNLDLHPGENAYAITIEPLPSDSPPPVLTSAIGDDGLPHLRLFQKQCWPVDIEYSTDLRNWKFHANAFYNREFPVAPSQAKVFYRAVRSP